MTGLGGNTEMWTPFVNEMPGRRIIRFDAPGTGLSGPPAGPMPVAWVSSLAAAVLDASGAPWADVIGFSYGGAVAQQLAVDAPGRIRRLVLAATTCGLWGIPGRFGALASLATTLRYYSPSYFDRTAAATYGGVTGRNASVRRQQMKVRRGQPPSPFGYTMQLWGTFGWSSWEFLPRIPHETLVICGDDDPLVPTANAEMLARRIPRARLEIVEGAGHLFLWDEPKDLADRIGRFLNRDHDAQEPQAVNSYTGFLDKRPEPPPQLAL